jgi:hypothetical protein
MNEIAILQNQLIIMQVLLSTCQDQELIKKLIEQIAFTKARIAGLL